MSEESQDGGMMDIKCSSLLVTTDFFTLTYGPKETQAVPIAVLFPEQEVTMNKRVHRELYLYIQEVSHEMTG